MNTKNTSANDKTHFAWNTNARVWDAKMGNDGNDFFRILQWPVITEFLGVSGWAGSHVPYRVLDIACGNGLTSRKLAELGAEVTAFDFSFDLIELAHQRINPGGRITYQVADATDEKALLALGEESYDFALCNMALFDMADIEPLFRLLPRLLKPRGCFVFSLTHPAFNNSSSVRAAEESNQGGVIKTSFSVKVTRYMSQCQALGVALQNQPEPQLYFDRPIQYYLNLGFKNGFVLDGFAERAFPPEQPSTDPLSWGGQFSEIPAVLVARMRLI